MHRHLQAYLVNAGQTVDNSQHDDGVAVRVVGDLDRHGVEQHLIQSVGEQRLRQLAEEVLQHACTTDIIIILVVVVVVVVIIIIIIIIRVEYNDYLSRFCTLLTSVPGRPLLRSADANKLLVPRSCTVLRSFGSSGPTAWNDMPAHLRNLDLSLSDFRQFLKTALFQTVPV